MQMAFSVYVLKDMQPEIVLSEHIFQYFKLYF